MRRHFRWRRISFSVSETGTREGRGKGGAASPGGSSGPTFGLGPHSPPGTGLKLQGSRQLGSGSRRSCWACAQTWVLVGPDRTGPAAGEVPSRPWRGRRVPGLAPRIPGPPPPAPAPLHTEVQGGGAARPHPGAGPGPPPDQGPPLEGLASARWEPGVEHLRLSARATVSRPLCPPLTPRPPPPISSLTSP